MQFTRQTQGLLWALLGITSFSFTLVATRMAVPTLGAGFVAFGRVVVGAVLAATVLLIRREKLPGKEHWPGLLVLGYGALVAFPLLTSMALRTLPASHGAVVNGLAPMMTAMAAVTMSHERPAKVFWVACFLGLCAVMAFALTLGAGHILPGDMLLLIAVVILGPSYAYGGKVTQSLGPVSAMGWALVACLPVALVGTALNLPPSPSVGVGPWFGFAYVSVISVFAGMLAWLHGLAIGGMVKLSQVQLLQPILTIIWAMVFLAERTTWLTWLTAIFVVGLVAVTQKSRMHSKSDIHPTLEDG